MCEKIKEHVVNGKKEYVVPSENGLDVSDGRIGEPLPSESDAWKTADIPIVTNEAGASLVRHHKGLTDISASSLWVAEETPGTFSVLKREGLEGYMVTLSCVLTSSQYAALIATLESTPTRSGRGVSVAVEFAPMTPNLVQPITAEST